MLARAQLTIGEADKFATVLGEQLQQLDGANIQSIMGSEAAVNGLISLIDAALLEADRLDAQLDTFDKLLYVYFSELFLLTSEMCSKECCFNG